MKDLVDEKDIIPILKKHGVVRAGIFGSFARGDQGGKSDMDFLVDFKKGKSLLDLVSLKFELEEKLGRKVDVITYKSLHPAFRNKVLKEQSVLYG